MLWFFCLLFLLIIRFVETDDGEEACVKTLGELGANSPPPDKDNSEGDPSTKDDSSGRGHAKKDKDPRDEGKDEGKGMTEHLDRSEVPSKETSNAASVNPEDAAGTHLHAKSTNVCFCCIMVLAVEGIS